MLRFHPNRVLKEGKHQNSVLQLELQDKADCSLQTGGSSAQISHGGQYRALQDPIGQQPRGRAAASQHHSLKLTTEVGLPASILQGSPEGYSD